MNEDEQIRNLYRQSIQEGIDWDDLKKEKKAFIKAHFSAAPFILFRPAFMIPAFSFCMVLGVFMILFPENIRHPKQGEISIVTVSADSKSLEAKPVSDFSALHNNIEVEPDSLVKEVDLTVPYASVDALRSDMGTPMVYQRTINDVPVVVIWVFSKAP